MIKQLFSKFFIIKVYSGLKTGKNKDEKQNIFAKNVIFFIL
jgi:hypothetical protein